MRYALDAMEKPAKPHTKVKHLGLRLPPELGQMLEELMVDEQKRVGAKAVVNGSSFLAGLIIDEHARRFAKGKK